MATSRPRRSGSSEPEAPALFVKRVALAPPAEGERRAEYPFDLPAVRTLGERELTAPVTVFVGENGMGKSTLLEALAVHLGLNAEGGSRNLRFSTKATHSRLHEALRVVRSARRPRDLFFLRAESFYNVATTLDALDGDRDNRRSRTAPLRRAYGDRSLHEQSHGESFFALFLNRLGPRGLYLLDEPESALSPQRQLALLVRMHDLVAQGSQFLVATHAPILMAHPGADVWLFEADGIRRVDARATDHWRVTKHFLADPDAMLRELLGG